MLWFHAAVHVLKMRRNWNIEGRFTGVYITTRIY